MKILIVGGVAGGASAAARARRLSEQAEIVILEKGPDVSFANCGLPYHVGGEIAERSKLLLQTPQSLHQRLNIDVRVLHEAVSIDPVARSVEVRRVTDGSVYVESYDHLILAPGASPLVPPIEGRERAGVFTLRDLSDMDRIIAWQTERAPKGRAVVVGVGFIGLEMAEQLHRRGMQVQVIEAADQVLPPLDVEMAAMIQAELEKHGVSVALSEFVSSIVDSSEVAVGEVVTKSGQRYPADLVLLSVGVRPNTALAATAGLVLGSSGGIQVDDFLRTSAEGIWAVGDAIETPHMVLGSRMVVPLGGPANRQGRLVATNILGQKARYRGSLGTAIVRVFELTAAITGASQKAVDRAKMSGVSVHLHPSSHAGYYPGAHPIALKLTFDPKTGKVLGAQAVGHDGVDKRVDILATAIAAGFTAQDLTELELCYAPPYGSAKDPVNLAGMVAQNVLQGLVEIADPFHLPAGDDVVYLDVREPAERAQGALSPSLHIPLGQLRGHLAEVPQDKMVIAYCASGLRSYSACRILSQNGYRCANLSGAYRTWSLAHPAESPQLTV